MSESNNQWNQPQPANLPRPTPAPFLLAFGTTLLFAGIVTSWIISLGGAGLAVAALVIWIHELRNDWKRLS